METDSKAEDVSLKVAINEFNEQSMSEDEQAAFLNVRLSGLQVTLQLEAIQDDILENMISQVEPFKGLTIDIGQISVEKQEALSKTFMNGAHKQSFERDQ